MKSKFLLLVLMVFVFVTGCYKSTFIKRSAVPGETRTVTNHFFILGLLGKGNVNARKLCPYGIASVTIYHSFSNLLLGILTLGIYTPNTVELVCALKEGEVNPPKKYYFGLTTDNEIAFIHKKSGENVELKWVNPKFRQKGGENE